MSQKQFREPSEAQPDLQSKPQRRSRWRPLSLLLLLGSVLVLGGGTLLVWQLVSHQPTLQKADVTIDCAHYPSGYHDALRQELAQGLHVTVTQVTAQVRAGKQIQDVAAAQHVSPDQLSGLERYAYKVTDVQLVHGGCMSQDTEEKHLHESASDLNHDFTLLFASTLAWRTT
jgi:hypothetical protein